MAPDDFGREAQEESVRRPNDRARLAMSLPYDGDGVIERPDGDLELDGFRFALDWDLLDPPTGHPDAAELTDVEAMTELCESLGLPARTL